MVGKDVVVEGRRRAESTTILLSARSLLVIFAGAMCLAFSLGRVLGSRGIVKVDQMSKLVVPAEQVVVERGPVKLPDPPILSGKVVPNNRYTSKYFDNGVKVRTSSALLKDEQREETECFIDEYGKQQCHANLTRETTKVLPTNPGVVSEDEEGLHQPAGQHLLVDIENVQAAFLNSEELLATAMIDVVKQSELTLLSYHCHGLIPTGVSCVGVLLESHVSFHTWPDEGVITLDLFTCGPKSILPLVDIMFKLFGVPRETGDEPFMVWSHKKRGFRHEGDAGASDLDRFLGDAELGKEEIASVTTEMQTMHIYDVVEPRFRDLQSHQRSLAKDGRTYESLHPELFQKDRLVFLDGVLQSRRYGEAAYHEALVHPAMIASREPKRVVIIGGGEGAVLREVLKHNTVEKVVVLEVDAKVTDVSKEFLHEWTDCSHLVGGSLSCFDDPRVELHLVDAVDWFMDNFGEEEGDILERDTFDVVLIDALYVHSR